MKKSIVVTNVTKKYKLYSNKKERLIDFITSKNYGEDFYALRDVTFEANKGDIIGFVGINGSGKSTLSNIIAGIVPETSGKVQVNGETSLIAVSAGLKGELTGRDNIELKCLMLGFNRRQIKEMEPDIIDFSELGSFIDQPVKSYSSGMRSRLGFAISVTVDPDILIIDEALSVGDKAFSKKSLNKMKEFKEKGKTMIFVSHSIGQMKRFCEKILWLEFGRVKQYGSVNDVLPKYEKFLQDWKRMSAEEKEIYMNLSLEDNKKGLKNILNIDENNNDKEDELFIEKPISRICKLKSNTKVFIYTDLGSDEKYVSTKEFLNCSYYSKKQVTYNNNKYYLLSSKPSALNSTIGWVKASEVSSHLHIYIVKYPKSFIFQGHGRGYSLPWGGKKNLVFSNLEQFKGSEFEVIRTDKVGKHLWYYGEIAGKGMWIHSNHVEKNANI